MMRAGDYRIAEGLVGSSGVYYTMGEVITRYQWSVFQYFNISIFQYSDSAAVLCEEAVPHLQTLVEVVPVGLNTNNAPAFE